MNKERIKYLDLAKGFAILLVIFGHVVTKKIIFRNWFYSYHIPLFFIVSGILIGMKYYNKDISEYDVKKRILSILKVYLISSILVSITLYIENALGIVTVKETFWVNIKNTLVLLGVKATWYLPCFGIALILFYYLRKNMVSAKKVLLISFGLFMLPYLIPKIEFDGIKVIFRSFIGLFYICIGFFGQNFIKNIKPSIFLITTLIAINGLTSYFMGAVDLWSLKLVDPILYLESALSGTLAVILIFKRLSMTKLKFKFLNFIGQNSLIYFTTHIVVVYLMKYFYFQIELNPFFNKPLVYGSIITLLVVLVELPFIFIINRLKLRGKKNAVNL